MSAFIQAHPIGSVLFALVWGLCAGLAECFMFTVRPPWAPRIAYVAMALAAFLCWPIIGALLLFEEPKPR
jgi:hypothetical protein